MAYEEANKWADEKALEIESKLKELKEQQEELSAKKTLAMERQIWEKTLSDLKSRLAEKEGQLTELMQIRDLAEKKDISEIEKLANERVTTLQNILSQELNLTRELLNAEMKKEDNLRQELKQKTAENEKLNFELERQSRQINRLASELDDLRKTASLPFKELLQERQKYETIEQQKFNELEQIKTDLTGEKAELQEKIRRSEILREELSKKAEQVRQLEKERDNLKALVAKRQRDMRKKTEDEYTFLEEVAFGIAHQLRNPLGIIRSNSEFCLANLKPKEKMRLHVEAIMRQIENMRSKLDQLLDFSKPIQLSLQSVSLPDVINATLYGLEERMKRQNVTVTKSWAEKMPAMKIDSAKLTEAFLCIAVNALEAMPKGGELTIKVEIRKDVYVSFIDTGAGIRFEHLPVVLAPFFTTKQDSFGLGLSLANRIVKAHGGAIEIESELGKGALIRVHLPFLSEEGG